MFGTARHSNYIANDLMMLMVVMVLSALYSLIFKILIQLFFSGSCWRFGDHIFISLSSVPDCSDSWQFKAHSANEQASGMS